MDNVNLLFFNHASSKIESDDYDLDSAISFVDSTIRLSGQCGFIIDFDEHKILYKSERLFYIEEATHSDFKRQCVNPYWSLVSEETLNMLLQIRDAFPRINSVLSRDEYSKMICTVDYPINIRGRQLFVTQKFTPLQMRHDGITKIGLFTINPSSRKTVGCMIIVSEGKRRFRFDFMKSQFVEFNIGTALTATERAIMFRVKMGMTNEEIAQNLCLSVNTIKSHRARIFKKLNVDTISEALTVLDNYQLL